MREIGSVDGTSQDLLATTLPTTDAALGGAVPPSPGEEAQAGLLRRRLTGSAIVVIVGLGIGLGTLAIGQQPLTLPWIGIGFASLLALLLLLWNFPLGVVLFLATCWIAVGTPPIAQGGSGGGAQRLLLSHIGLIALIGMGILRSPFVGGAERIPRTPMNLPIALFLTICVWSTVNGLLLPDPHVLEYGPKVFWQVNVLELMTRFLALGGLLLIGAVLRGRYLPWAAIALAVPGVMTFSGLVRGIPSSFYLAFPQVIAMSLLAAFALTGSWAGARWRWLRVPAGALAVAIFVRYFFQGTEWVSGWSAALVALAVITYCIDRRLLVAGAAILAIAVLLNYSYFFKTVYTDNFYAGRTAGDINRTGQTGRFTNDRSRMLLAAVRYADTFPLGVGLGNYRAYNQYYGRRDVWNTTTFTSAHGTYAQTLSETGWLGLGALLLLLGTCVRFLWRCFRALPASWGRTYLLGALGATIGIFVAAFLGDYLFPTYHNGGLGSFGACVYLWFTIGLATAVAREYELDWDRLIARSRPAPRAIAPVYGHGPYAPNAAEAETG